MIRISLFPGLFVFLALAIDTHKCPKRDNPKVLQGARSLNFMAPPAVSRRGANCYWVLENTETCTTGTPIVTVLVTFLNLESYSDDVSFYDGSELTTKKIRSFTGKGHRGSDWIQVSSSGSQLLVVLTAKGTRLPLKMYLAFKYTCLEPVETNFCHDEAEPLVLNQQTGTTELVLSKERYLNNLDCFWLIQNIKSCANSKPTVEVDLFYDLEVSLDWISLYAGDKIDDKKILGKFSGEQDYGVRVISGDDSGMLLHFHSDPLNIREFEGWKINVHYYCGTRLDICPVPNSGNPTVLYPPSSVLAFNEAPYTRNLNCEWMIENNATDCVNVDPVVIVSLIDYHVEEKQDFISLYLDGTETGPIQELRSGIGGEYEGQIFTSVGKRMMIRFESDSASDLEYRGWALDYQFVCAGELPQSDTESCPPLAQPQESTEPGSLIFNTRHYLQNIDCGWLISNPTPPSACPSGTPIIDIDFAEFETELYKDYVSLYDGTNTTAPRLGTWSGTKYFETPRSIRSSGPSLFVAFHSDASFEGNNIRFLGFLANFTFACADDPLPITYHDCRDEEGHLVLGVEALNASFDPMRNVTLNDTKSTLKGKEMEMLYFEHHRLPLEVGVRTVLESAYADPAAESKINSTGQSGELIQTRLLRANQYADTMSCCNDLNTTSPKHNVTGRFALCRRGGCPFLQKHRIVQNAGAVGMVVIDASDKNIRMAGKNANDIVTPAVTVARSFGDWLLALLELGQLRIKTSRFVCPTTDHFGSLAPTLEPTRRTPKPTHKPGDRPPTAQRRRPTTPGTSRVPRDKRTLSPTRTPQNDWKCARGALYHGPCLTGNDTCPARVGSLKRCTGLCDRASGCTMISYNESGCYLKTSYVRTSNDRGHTSCRLGNETRRASQLPTNEEDEHSDLECQDKSSVVCGRSDTTNKNLTCQPRFQTLCPLTCALCHGIFVFEVRNLQAEELNEEAIRNVKRLIGVGMKAAIVPELAFLPRIRAGCDSKFGLSVRAIFPGLPRADRADILKHAVRPDTLHWLQDELRKLFKQESLMIMVGNTNYTTGTLGEESDYIELTIDRPAVWLDSVSVRSGLLAGLASAAGWDPCVLDLIRVEGGGGEGGGGGGANSANTTLVLRVSQDVRATLTRSSQWEIGSLYHGAKLLSMSSSLYNTTTTTTTTPSVTEDPQQDQQDFQTRDKGVDGAFQIDVRCRTVDCISTVMVTREVVNCECLESLGAFSVALIVISIIGILVGIVFGVWYLKGGAQKRRRSYFQAAQSDTVGEKPVVEGSGVNVHMEPDEELSEFESAISRIDTDDTVDTANVAFAVG